MSDEQNEIATIISNYMDGLLLECDIDDLLMKLNEAVYGNTKPLIRALKDSAEIFAQNEILKIEIASLKAEIERLRAENEDIRQHCITHDTYKVVIEQTRKDTAREILQHLFDELTCGDLGEFCDTGWMFTVDEAKAIAKEYGIEIAEKECEE